LNKDEFFIHEIGCQDTIDVKRAYIDLAGDLVAGVMLSQLVYWHLPQKRTPTAEKLRVFHEGQLWLAKKREDWWTECRITPKQVDRAVSILTGKAALEVNGDTGYPQIPLIEAKLFKFANAPTLHLRILWENFLPAYEEAARKVAEEMGFEAEGDFTQRGKSEVILPKGENGFSPNGKINLPQTVKSLTKNTAKTTAKTKDNAPIGAAPLLTKGGLAYFTAWQRKRWANEAQRKAFEAVEAEVGSETMVAAVQWAANAGISDVNRIIKAARGWGKPKANGGARAGGRAAPVGGGRTRGTEHYGDDPVKLAALRASIDEHEWDWLDDPNYTGPRPAPVGQAR